MKKVLSLVLILSLALTMASFPAFAEGGNAVELLGANIRLTSSGYSAGIRFGATLDKASVGITNYWTYDTSDVEFGMYLLPADLLEEGQTLTEYVANGGDKALKVVATKYSKQTEDELEFTAVLVDIPTTAYNREIVAVPYVIMSGETEATYYEETSDSYVGVAKKAIESGDFSGDDLADLEDIVATVEPEVPAEPVVIDIASAAVIGIEGTGAEKIFDNNTSDSGAFTSIGEVAADGDPLVFTVELDLGAEYQLTELAWVGSKGFAKNAIVYGSNDPNGDWAPIHTIEWYSTTYTEEEGHPYQWRSFCIDEVTTTEAYRYLKIEVSNVHGTEIKETGAWNGPTEVLISEIDLKGIPVTGDEGEEPSPSLVYYDVDAAPGASNYNGRNRDASSLFVLPAGYNAYKIDGTYKVDADTLRKLAKTPCIGDGTIAYKDYINFTSYISTVEPSWGQRDDQGYGPDNYGEQILSAPVSKLSDPIYMSMVLPSEGTTYMNKDDKPQEDRNNGNNMHAPSNDTVFDRLNSLGAVYINKALKSELKAKYSGEQINLYIGNIRLLVRTADGWIERNVAVPQKGFGMLYALPWQLEGQLGSNQYQKLCVNVDNNIRTYSNYSKITLEVDDFLENKTGMSWSGTNFDERVFHFWGGIHYLSELGISQDTDVIGVIASYEMWIEEAELAPYFISSIGADWRLTSGTTRQAFAGYKHAVFTEKQIVFGHSFGAEDYETYVAGDLEYIKATLGIN